MSRLLLIFVFLIAATASAEEKGYKVVRPDGTVEFSDQPQPGAVEIPLPQSQGYEPAPLPPSESDRGVAHNAVKSVVTYRQLTITAPVADETFQSAEGPVHVQVQIEPSLQPGHKLVILLDGKAAGSGVSATLANLDRGTHTVSAEVRDGDGKVVKSSAPVTFHVKQYSSLFKKKAAP